MTEITLPKAGQTMEDGTIVEWHKAEGDAVAKGEVLLEVETDKAVVEIESPGAGTLRKILVGEGETVPVLTTIAILGEPDEDVSDAVAKAQRERAETGEAGAQQSAGPGEQAPAARSEPADTAKADTASPQETGGAGNVTPIVMPKAGQSVEEAVIVKWNVQPGDRIAEGDVILEIETDKAAIEVEATDAGRLARIVADEGDVVEVLDPIAYLAEDDADVDAYLAAHGGAPAKDEAPAPQASPAGPKPDAAKPTAPAAGTPPPTPASAGSAPTTESGRVKASPYARKTADGRGVDLAQLGPGSGPGGRILSTDVPAAAAGPAPAAAPPAPATGEVVRRPLAGMRKAIARNLQASKQTIPHFYMRMTFDAGAMQDFYRGEKAKYPCSLNDVMTLAVARTVREFPAFRSRLEGDQIVEYPAASIGIAVGMENGLVVPVVRGADAMDLRTLAAESKRLVEAARGGKIENMGQGVMTITNLGMFGVDDFSAIINPPEASILAVGTIREEVIVSGGTMRPGRVMTVTLSADHRVIDGLGAAKFLARLKERVEMPVLL